VSGVAGFGLLLGILSTLIGAGMIIAGETTGIAIVGLGLTGSFLNWQRVRRLSAKSKSSA
jgi:hypothetical protein